MSTIYRCQVCDYTWTLHTGMLTTADVKTHCGVVMLGEMLDDEPAQPQGETNCSLCGNLTSRVPVLGPLICDDCKKKHKQKPQPSVNLVDYWNKPLSEQDKIKKSI